MPVPRMPKAQPEVALPCGFFFVAGAFAGSSPSVTQ